MSSLNLAFGVLSFILGLAVLGSLYVPFLQDFLPMVIIVLFIAMALIIILEKESIITKILAFVILLVVLLSSLNEFATFLTEMTQNTLLVGAVIVFVSIAIVVVNKKKKEMVAVQQFKR